MTGPESTAGAPERASETVREGPETLSIALGDADAGSRLDRFLAVALGVSRGEARTLLARGAVSLEGRTLGYGDKGLSLPGAGRLEVRRLAMGRDQRARPAGPVPVLAEGAGWLAVDKPAGVPVHPLREDEDGTVLNALVASHPAIHGVGEGGLRSGVVHRLDVDTSGVLLFATESEAWRRLREAFRSHRVEKVYRAIATGAFPDRACGEASFELTVARHRPAFVRVIEDALPKRGRAHPVRQTIRVLERLGRATLLEVRIETGFLHQIRATLSHLGHPIVGDALYGGGEALARGAKRQMLHAARVRFEEIVAESPDPDDFAQLLERLRAEELA